MKAALLRKFDQPLSVEQISIPSPGPGQVLLRVEACGVCHTDVHIARGQWESFKNRMRLPVVPGHEVAGVVAAAGPGIDKGCVGRRAGVAWFHSTCGDCSYCREGLEVYCDRSQVTGVDVDGGFADYLVVPADHAVTIPDAIPSVQAAPLFCAGGTVFSALKKVALAAGSRLVVWGTGGLGHLAIQLGLRKGATVTAVDLLAHRLDVARALGAQHVLDARDAPRWFQDPARQADVALVTATSAAAYRDALGSLRKNGVLLVVGLPAEPLGWTAADLVRSGARVIPSRVSSRAELKELLALDPPLDCRIELFALDQVNEAMRRVQSGDLQARAVLTMTA